MDKQNSKAFVIDGWRVSPLEGTLRRGDRVTRLEPRAMEVLTYLASRPGEVVTRDELERDVWHGAIIGYDAVTSTVIKLRKALEDDARHPRVIATIPKRGYKLLSAPSYPADTDRVEYATPPSAPATEASRSRSQQIPPANIRVRYWVLPAMLGTGLIAGLIWLASSPSLPQRSNAVDHTESPAAKPTIAVLPFENLGTDPGEGLLADGLTEDIITDLSRLADLQVIASTTSAQYKDTPLDPAQIGKELNVRFLLKGSIRRLGDAIRVNTQLIDVESGYNAWAQRYDRRIAEVFAVQDEVTRQIVESLAIKMSEQEEQRLAHRATANLEAYALFQEGQRFFKIRTEAANRQADALYRRAIQADASYGRAYGALAVTLVTAFREGWADSPIETLDRSLELAKRAVALDDTTPQTYWALGFVHLHRKEFDRAEEATRRAIDVAPTYADGHGLLALMNAYLGRPKKALELMDKAVLFNPYYTSEYLVVYGIAHYCDGDYASARKSLEAAQERNQNFVLARLLLAATYMRTDQQEDAEWIVQELEILHPRFTLSHLQKALPIADEELKKRLSNDLRSAGLAG